MSVVRANRVALLAAAVFFTIFMGLVHFHLGDSTSISDPEPLSNPNNAPPPPPGPIVTAVPDEKKPDEKKPDVKPTSNPTVNTNKPSPTATEEEPDKLEIAPAPPVANVDAFHPEQWVFPAVKPDSPEYASYGHWPDKLPEGKKPLWTESLGKKLCIIDMESRSFDKPGQLWSDRMTWNHSEEVHGPSGGSLNHWAYAKIHGYQYYYVKINTYADRRDSWKKPSVLSKIVKNHDVCIFIDSDALFNHLELPMEWLMNYWGVQPKQHAMSLPFDPDTAHNLDRHGKLFLNTGFMILQNTPKLYEIFKEWDDCPNEGGKYPDCTEFRNRKGWQPTDQGGFGTFIRYDYPENILELPCSEANGFPESKTECVGKYIKHVWLGKEDRLVVAVGDVFPGVLLETFHKQFNQEKDIFYTTEDALMADGPPF